MPLIEERVKEFESIVLARGSHSSRGDGMCIMEAVAWLAGREHTDAPECVSPVLRSFLVRWNDDLDDAGRQMLKPYALRVIGTAGDGKDEARGWMAADWLIRVHTPAWLELAGIKESAAALRALPPLADPASLQAVKPQIDKARSEAAAAWAAAGAAAWDAARNAARNAAWAAAGDAAGDAAWDAAGAAAWDAAGAAGAAARNAAGAAAWDAARNAAGDAAGAAAGDAARNAARDAAWNAAGKKLEPTKVELRKSALELLDRMIAA